MPAAIALTVILAALAVFQLALALGAPLGRFAWGGQHRVLPTGLRVGSLVSIVVYAVIVVLALDKVGLIDVVPDAALTPQSDARLVIHRADGTRQEVTVTLRIDTPIEVDYYQAGGILPFVLRQLLEG